MQKQAEKEQEAESRTPEGGCVVKEEYKKMLRNWRRDLHRYPETGWTTYRTSILIAQALQEAGYEVWIGEEIIPWEAAVDAPSQEEIETCRRRCREELPWELWERWQKRMGRLGGVVARFDSHRPGLRVACRWDMDALQIPESRDGEHVPEKEGFVSVHPGCFHGCGHDGHAAVGVVTALRLLEHAEWMQGQLLVIFQPAEEGVRGAESYCQNWKFGTIDRLICGHIGFTDADCLVAGAGGFLATSKLDAEFFGVSAHAGLCPERGRNALLAAAASVVSMEQMKMKTEKQVRLNVGVLQGGETRNTIPAYCRMQLETRGKNREQNDEIRKAAEDILKNCAASYGVRVQITKKGASTDAVSSDGFSIQIRDLVRFMRIYETCLLHQKFGASDDGAVFMNMVQKSGGEAAYLLFGSPLAGRHHENNFDFDESVLDKSCEIYVQICRMLLDQNGI